MAGYNETKHISPELLDEISQALKGLDYGSIEIYVQAGEIVQITKRHIRKINGHKAAQQL